MNPALIALPVGVLTVASVFHGNIISSSGAAVGATTAQVRTLAVAELRYQSGGVIVTARTGTRLITLHVKAAKLQTVDSGPLAPTSVRVGDTIAVVGTAVRDLSQIRTTVHGIVDVASVSANDPLVLHLRPNYSIVVDVSSDTRYSDPSGQTSAVDQIEDADVMRLSGVYDARLGEMTQVRTMTREGPYRHPGKH